MKSTPPKYLWNVYLGNLFEHYDTALFGFLSPFISPLIFPQQDSLTALTLTYLLIPLGMLARPIGPLFFGYIGDLHGRERSLFLTLTGMAFISACIAITPTYAQVGILAPILFCLGRGMQNFFAAGETMGGAIFLLENTRSKQPHDVLSSFYSASAMRGHMLASLGVYVIAQYFTVESGWRLLYLFGCMTAIFGCRIRQHHYVKSPISEKFTHTISALKSSLWSNRHAFFTIILNAGFAHATYSMALVLMNGLIPLISSLTHAEVMKMNSGLLVLDFCALPLFGWIASKISRETLMLSVSISSVLMGIPLLTMLGGASVTVIVTVRAVLVIFGIAFFAPFHAWAQQLVPFKDRYAIISLGYAIGSQILGSPTSATALWCFKQTGLVSSVAWYWVLLGIAASLSLAASCLKENSPNRQTLH